MFLQNLYFIYAYETQYKHNINKFKLNYIRLN
jgi:hypothetical protein